MSSNPCETKIAGKWLRIPQKFDQHLFSSSHQYQHLIKICYPLVIFPISNIEDSSCLLRSIESMAGNITQKGIKKSGIFQCRLGARCPKIQMPLKLADLQSKCLDAWMDLWICGGLVTQRIGKIHRSRFDVEDM